MDDSSARFKAEMPQIPGVSPSSRRGSRSNPLLPLIAGVIVLGVVRFSGCAGLDARSGTAARPRGAHSPTHVPAPPPDPASLLPHAEKAHPVIAERPNFPSPGLRPISSSAISPPAKRARLGLRLSFRVCSPGMAIGVFPPGPLHPPTGIYSRSRRFRKENDYHSATHPLVGNPCSHTLYDSRKPLTFRATSTSRRYRPGQRRAPPTRR